MLQTDKYVETCVCCGAEGDLEPYAQGPLCPTCKVKTREQLKHKQAWRAYWEAVLDLWAHAAEAGYPSSKVKAFTFRPEFLDNKQKRRYDFRRETGTTRFNCVRLHTGELKPIPMIERPQKPDGNDPSDD